MIVNIHAKKSINVELNQLLMSVPTLRHEIDNTEQPERK